VPQTLKDRIVAVVVDEPSIHIDSETPCPLRISNLKQLGDSAKNLPPRHFLKALNARIGTVSLLLAFGLHQFQNPELLLRDVGQRDGQSDANRVQNGKRLSGTGIFLKFRAIFSTFLAWTLSCAPIMNSSVDSGNALRLGLCVEVYPGRLSD